MFELKSNFSWHSVVQYMWLKKLILYKTLKYNLNSLFFVDWSLVLISDVS